MRSVRTTELSGFRRGEAEGRRPAHLRATAQRGGVIRRDTRGRTNRQGASSMHPQNNAASKEFRIVVHLNNLASTCGIIYSIHDAVRDTQDDVRVVWYES